MSKSQFAMMTVLVMVAVFAGVVVASLVPPVIDARAEELRLAAPAPGAASIAVPSFADLAEQALPSVVQIRSTRFVTETQDPMRDNPFFRRWFFNEEGRPDEQPRERPDESGGSGFFITADGHILTNRHVVEGGEQFRVTTYEGDEYEAKLVGFDPYLDVALLKVDGNGAFRPMALGDSDELRVGEWVMAIGHPITFDNTVTVGVVSGKGRRLLAGGARDVGNYIQTDAAINRGNSGGPLVNVRGEAIGINTAIIRGGFGGAGVEGIGFALPIKLAREILDQLVTTGTVRRGWLGVAVRAVDEEIVSFYGLPSKAGALVSDVTEGSPAADAGVKQGDVVVSIDGVDVRDSSDLVEKVSRRRPDETVELGIWRLRDQNEPGSGSLTRVRVKLGDRRVGLDDEPASAPSRRDSEGDVPETGSVTLFGFTVEPMPGVARERLGESGVIVTDVDARSPALVKGLAAGQVITAFNGKPTPSLKDYREAAEGAKPGSVVRLTVLLPDRSEVFVFFRVP